MIGEKEMGINNPLFVEFLEDVAITNGIDASMSGEFADIYFSNADIPKEDLNKVITLPKGSTSDDEDIKVALRFVSVNAINSLIDRLEDAKLYLLKH